MKKHITIFISSGGKKGFFKEIHISGRRLLCGLIGVGAMCLLLTAFMLDYLFVFSSDLSHRSHRAENKHLKSQLSRMRLKMEKVHFRLRQIEDFSHKIKTIAGLQQPADPSSALAMGPLSSASFPDVSSSYGAGVGAGAGHAHSSLRAPASDSAVSVSATTTTSPPSDSVALSLVNTDSFAIYMESLDKKSRLTQEDITTLLEQLYERKDIMLNTPSILPAKGWISSRFGYRQYPFTGEVSLHEGMDIAASPGTPVYAPAGGVIVFAGYKQGYGKVIVIDHGYELSTLYGHLSEIMVSSQQKVERKQVIGAIGSTGHSSGPHLHYEVRISNVPVDPNNYILDSL